MMNHKKTAKEIALKAIEEVKAKNVLKKVNIKGNYLIVGKEKVKIPERIYVFGSGKAAFSFAKEFEKKFKKRIEGGVVISYKEEKAGKSKIRFLKGNHPFVGKESLKSSKVLINEMEKLSKEDFFVYFLSGGTSAMLEEFKEGVSLRKAKELNKKWIKEGLSIEEINKRRIKISKIKGGKLAKRVKAKGIILVVSDVVGDKLEFIGSAPFYEGKGKAKFKHVIIANNEMMLWKAKKESEKKGFKAEILTSLLKGEAREIAKAVLSIAKYRKREGKRIALILGGETTVTVKGKGRGGRNQEFCLSSLLDIEKDIVVLAVGSDGIDFNEYAGAVVNKGDLDKARRKRIDLRKALENNDSTTALGKLNCLIKTNYTGTNVMDLILVLIN